MSRKIDATEHQEQCALFEWAALASGKYPELGLMYAVPNGGHRHPAVAAKLKAEGVKPGVPDICLPVARGGFHGLYIEMKSSSGRISEEQRKFGEGLSQQGYWMVVCRSWDAARIAILGYLCGEGQRLDRAYYRQEGYFANFRGLGVAVCPYAKGTDAERWWMDGWRYNAGEGGRWGELPVAKEPDSQDGSPSCAVGAIAETPVRRCGC